MSRQLTREGTAFRLTTDYWKDVHKVKMKAQATSTPDLKEHRFWAIRKGMTQPEDQDIEAMESVYPGFKEKYQEFLDGRAGPDIEQLQKALETAIAEMRKSAADSDSKLVSENATLKLLVKAQQETIESLKTQIEYLKQSS